MTAAHIGIVRWISLTLGLAFSLSAVSTSLAFAYSARAQQMCMGDAMRLCSSEIPNISRIIACMRRNKANVSAGCRMVMEQEDPVSRPKPVQAASAEQKPPGVARTEPPAPARPKPVQVTPLAPPPTVRAEPPVPVAPKPVPAAAVEHKPATAPVVVKSSAIGAKADGASFEQETIAGPPAATQGSAALSVVARVALTEAKLAQLVAAEEKAVINAPVATEPKPVQAAAVEQRAALATPAAAKPVEVKPAPVVKPAKVVRRKQKLRHVAAASYMQRDTGGYERYISMAAPIMSMIMTYW
jgi:hypothetical protein